MCGHPTHTCLGSGPSKALQIPTASCCPRPPGLAHEGHIKHLPALKTMHISRCRDINGGTAIRSRQSQRKVRHCPVRPSQSKVGASSPPPECPDPSPPLQRARALRWNTYLLGRATTHWPSPTQLHRNHPG